MGFYRLPIHFENIRKYSQLYVIEHIENGYELSTVEVTFSKRIKDEFTDVKELHFMHKGIEIIFKVDTLQNSFYYTNPQIFLTIFTDKDIAIKQMQKYLTKLKVGNNLKMTISN